MTIQWNSIVSESPPYDTCQILEYFYSIRILPIYVFLLHSLFILFCTGQCDSLLARVRIFCSHRQYFNRFGSFPLLKNGHNRIIFEILERSFPQPNKCKALCTKPPDRALNQHLQFWPITQGCEPTMEPPPDPADYYVTCSSIKLPNWNTTIQNPAKKNR